MEKFCISIDWLQTYCLGDVIPDGSIASNDGYKFSARLQASETAQFKHLLHIYVGNLMVATVQQCPRTSVINQRATLVKLENRVLYSEQYIKLLYALQRAFNLTYKGITRIDICYDCNKLHDGRNVERFIKDFVTKESGELGHIVRKGSARFSLHGTRKQTAATKYNSISWGSPKSKIRCYCYDKTLELAEVKDKPWIRKMWHDNGLLYDINFDELAKKDKRTKQYEYDNIGFGDYVGKRVWRFEISIGSQGQDILNMSTGELFRLSPKYIEHYENVRKLFYIYAEKVFCFSFNTGQKRIRNYPRLQIFEEIPDITSKPININKNLDCGRMEKVCYNKLKRLSEEYSDLTTVQRTAILAALDFLAEISGKKSSIVRMDRTRRYLDELKGKSYLSELDAMYIAALNGLVGYRKAIDADTLYECFIDNDYWDICRENQGLIPPEDYFF